MIAIFKRLRQIFSRESTAIGRRPDQRSEAVAVKRHNIHYSKDGIKGASATILKNQNHKTSAVEDAPIPDIYAKTNLTVPNLKIVDDDESEIEDSPGFNPYDTAVLNNKAKHSKY